MIETDPRALPIAAEENSEYDSKHSREYLDDFIQDYNEMFQRNYSTSDFYSYYKDIGKQVKQTTGCFACSEYVPYRI